MSFKMRLDIWWESPAAVALKWTLGPSPGWRRFGPPPGPGPPGWSRVRPGSACNPVRFLIPHRKVGPPPWRARLGWFTRSSRHLEVLTIRSTAAANR